MSETRELASFVTRTSESDVPADARTSAIVAIRDFLGVALAGSATEVGGIVDEYVRGIASGGGATVFSRGTASAPCAALANGTFGHALDYDDTFESIVVHPTTVVVPALFAVAETNVPDADGRAVLDAYVVGLEVASRVGHATYPAHYDNGWHSTGTVGAFGAAAAAAAVLDLDVGEVSRAFGIVASLSSALKKNFGSMTKPLHAGHAASMGVRAVLLATAGFTADEAILEGPLGYGTVMTPGSTYEPSAVVDGLGEEWAVDDLGFKPYPSGVITHAAMESMRDLRTDHGLTPEDIECVVVSLDEAANEMLIHRNPWDALQAKFSIEFCLAAVLREGDAGLAEFTDAYVRDARTRAVMETVERDFEAGLFDGTFANYGARVVVETTDGSRFKAAHRYAPGTPSNPTGEARLAAKFRETAGRVLDDSAVESLGDAIDGLDDGGDLQSVLAVLRPSSGGG